jgi:hypothetical protein
MNKSPKLQEIKEALNQYPNGEILPDQVINSLTNEQLAVIAQWEDEPIKY